jgi:glycosyltransferase involved in cell wall biosynthesis
MNVICHAFPAWEGDYFKSTVALMKGLADRGNRVLYIDYAYTWKDLFKSMFGKGHASWKRMTGLEYRLRLEKTGNGGEVWILTLPPAIPANFLGSGILFNAVMAFNGFWMKRAIRKAVDLLRLSNPVVVNAFNPGYGIQLGHALKESKLVYYCYDEIGAAAWAGKHGPRLEKEFIDLADAVVVSSEGLLMEKKEMGKPVYVVKNGVDFDQFAKEQGRVEIPAARIGQQIIGYLGSVDDRLDYPMLEAGFRQLPGALFVFVGRIQSDAIRQRLSAFKNVYLAGPRPPAELPAWVQRMHVGLIPFVKNAFTAGIYPLKINEYLACGKQVVSSRFAPLPEFEKVVLWAETPDEFVASLRKALTRPNNVAGREFAKGNDWSARAGELERILR